MGFVDKVEPEYIFDGVAPERREKMGLINRPKRLIIEEYDIPTMTFIIGAKCSDGIILASDRKVTDPESSSDQWADKITIPLPGVAVCAAGLADLFIEFERKIKLTVEQRQREYYLKNVLVLRQMGTSEEQILNILTPKKIQSQTHTLSSQIIQQETVPIPILHIYSAEYFLDDSKNLVAEICDEQKYGPHALDVLILINVNQPSLHHIDYRGRESEVKTSIGIGSGRPYLSLVFRKLWTKDMTMLQSASIACFNIKAIQELRLEPTVGVEQGTLPQIIMAGNDGSFGNANTVFANNAMVLSYIQTTISGLENKIKGLAIPAFEFKSG